MAEEIYILVKNTNGNVHQTRREEIEDKAARIRNKLETNQFIESFVLNGAELTESSTFVEVNKILTIPSPSVIFPGASVIEAKLIVVSKNDASSTGEIDLFNFTDSAAITGSELSVSGSTFDEAVSSDWFDISALAGKAVKPRIRRVTGIGTNKTRIQGIKLLYRIKST